MFVNFAFLDEIDKNYDLLNYNKLTIQPLYSLKRIYCPTEREIAYIITQVSRILPLPYPTFVDITGPGWHSVHRVLETRSPAYINRAKEESEARITCGL
jgi:hypothetical protein